MFLNTNHIIALKILNTPFQDFENKNELYHVGVLKKICAPANVGAFFL